MCRFWPSSDCRGRGVLAACHTIRARSLAPRPRLVPSGSTVPSLLANVARDFDCANASLWSSNGKPMRGPVRLIAEAARARCFPTRSGNGEVRSSGVGLYGRATCASFGGAPSLGGMSPDPSMAVVPVVVARGGYRGDTTQAKQQQPLRERISWHTARRTQRADEHKLGLQIIF